jgi:hypothetical protein
MNQLLAKIREHNGMKISIQSYRTIDKFTEDKIKLYRSNGLLPNECRTNSQAVARFLGDEALVIEGFLVTADKCCYPHMWVKYQNTYIDLTLELFEKTSDSNEYYELFTHKIDNSKFPKDLLFSERTNKLLADFHEKNSDCKIKYDELYNKLHQKNKCNYL